MDLIKLKAFSIIARTGSFSKAAEELFVTQPAVSAQIKDLERLYEVKLFERIGHSIELTEEGKALLPYAELIVKAIEESKYAVEDIKNSRIGSIRVGASALPGMYMLPEIISFFNKEYPGVSVSLKVSFATEIRKMISNNELEIGIVGSYNKRISQAQGNGSILVEELLCNDRMVLIVSPEHSLANRDKILLGELANEPMILPPRAALTRRSIEEQFKELNIPLRIVSEFGNVELIKRMVQKNFGVSIIPRTAVRKEQKENLLRAIEISNLNMERHILVIYRKNKNFSDSLKAFHGFLKNTNISNILGT